MHVDHLQGGELLQRAARREARGKVVQTARERDLETIGEDGDEDVGFDAFLALMEDRTDRKVALEGVRTRK
jgi:ADP-ribose pyrophosphatase YjhB (NUDIX family)